MEKERSQDEILEAEQEFYDRLWYIRHNEILEEYRYKDPHQAEELEKVGGPHARKLEERYGEANLRCDQGVGLGMVRGKLSALRWVLGNEWDFLDT